MRLFRNRGFAAAAATVFMVGAALFGAMIILPLYYQVARGESALTAGLLMAPQGLGAAMAMPLAGRLTDRVGGGRGGGGRAADPDGRDDPVRVPRPDTSYGLLAGLLVLRGLGIGSVDDAVDGRRLRDARVRRGAAGDEHAQRAAADRRVAGHGAARGRAAGRDHDRSAGPATGEDVGQVPEAVRARVAEPLGVRRRSGGRSAMSVVALIPAAVLAVTQTRERARAAGAVAEPERLPA